MTKRYKVLGLTSENSKSYLKSVIKNSGFELKGLLEINPKNLDRVAMNHCDAIIVYSDDFNDDESNFITKLNKEIKDTKLILITSNYSVDILASAMQCGISKVITTSMSQDEMFREIVNEIEKDRENTSASTPTGGRKGKIISVFGTKGGTGKSTVSVNLATALQLKGNKVAIMDLDLQFGDVGVFMNVPKVETISDLVKEGSFSFSTIKRYMYQHNTGVSILCGPQSPELAEIVKPEHIVQIVQTIKHEFDYIVFDMSPTIDEFVLQAIDISDSIYFVTNPEIPTLKNTKVCLNVLSTLGHDNKVKIVLNKDGDSYVKKKDMEATLNKKISLVIPRDSKNAISAINRGVPLVVVSPRSKASRAILKYIDNEGV